MKFFGVEFDGPFNFDESLSHSPGIILLGIRSKGEFSIKEVICDMDLHNKIVELASFYSEKIIFYLKYLPECNEVDLTQIAYFLKNFSLKNEHKVI